jgi:hypothetical protein
MKYKILISLITIMAFAAISANAQFGDLKKTVKGSVNSKKKQTEEKSEEKSNENKHPGSAQTSETKTARTGDVPPFLYIGADKMDGVSIAELRVCADNYVGANSLKKEFKQWIDAISDVAKEKMFAAKRCELMGYYISDNPARKYKDADSLETVAQGNSVYEVENDKLVLVKDFVASAFYVVVVPDANKASLTLADLNLCVTPDLKNTYRKKTKSVSNCHDTKQALYVFEQYKSYPGPMQTNSALFSAADFETLNKQGKFKGLVIYKLNGDMLEPVK